MLASCSILLLALSQHVGAKNDFRETHPSIGVSCPTYSTGYFLNSEGDHTIWWAKRKYWQETSVFGEAGGAIGYKDYPVAPMARVGYSMKYVEFFAMPGIETWNNERKLIMILGLQFKMPIE